MSNRSEAVEELAGRFWATIYCADPAPVQYEDDFSTTFWSDFTIAEAFGMNAVADTFNRAFSEWRSDYRYLTDLVIVLNHKTWQHWDSNRKLGELYCKLFETADRYAVETLKGDELHWFYKYTD